MKIDLYMDLTCPWCYIGLKRLQLAMAELPAETFVTTFVGYQLRDDLSRQGILYRENLQKFLLDEESLQRHLAKVTAIGREVGATFAFDKKLITCQTLDAHRLLKYAPDGRKMDLLEAMYEGVFKDALNLGQPEDLAQIGERVGIGTQQMILDFLRSDIQKPQVQADFALSARTPIITIPYLVIDGSYPVQAVHLPDVATACLRSMAN